MGGKENPPSSGESVCTHFHALKGTKKTYLKGEFHSQYLIDDIGISL